MYRSHAVSNGKDLLMIVQLFFTNTAWSYIEEGKAQQVQVPSELSS